MQDGDPASYDPDGYYRRVVRDLRRRPDELPPDLFVRYALPPDLAERPAAWLAAHLRAVVADWASRVEPTREGAVYAALLAAHEALTGAPGADPAAPSWWVAQRATAAAPPVAAPPVAVPPGVAPPGVAPSAAAPSAAAPPAGPAPTGHASPGAAPPDPDLAGPVLPAPRPRPEPLPADPAHAAAQLRPSARRVGAGAELRWTWPTWAAVTDVVVDGGRVRVSRHAYRQYGRWRLAVDPEQVEVELMVRGPAGESLHGRVVVPPRRQEVRFAVRRLSWPPGSRTYRFSFTPVAGPPAYCRVQVGYSTSRVMPGGVDDLVTDGASTAIYEACQTDLTVPRDACWVSCFLIEGADAVELVEPDVEQLRVH